MLYEVITLYVAETVLLDHLKVMGRLGIDYHLLVQRLIDRFGHCTFTPGEQLTAFGDLVNWVETGVAPTPSYNFV